MNQLRTTEEILRELIRRKEIEYLRKEQLFVNAIADMGGAKRDIRLLRYLVEVDGVSSLLDAAGQPQSRRQTIYSQTVDRLCSQAVISRENAQEICGIFWRAVYNEEPPITPQKKMTSEPEKSRASSEPPAPSELDIRISQLREELAEKRKAASSSIEITEKKTKPVPQRHPQKHTKLMALVKKMPFFRPEHTRRQRILLMLGWGLLLFEILLGILEMGLFLSLLPLIESTSFIDWVIMLFLLFMIFIPTAGLQACLWKWDFPLRLLVMCSLPKFMFLLVMLPSSLYCIFTGDSSGFGYNAGVALYSSLNMVYLLLGWLEVA